MRKLDVLLVSPADLGQVYQARDRKQTAQEPPKMARFVASYLLRRRVSLNFIDSAITGFEPAVMAEKVAERNPHLVILPVMGFNPSASTQTMSAASAFAKAIKERNPEVPIMMMGTHPAALPALTLMTELAVDFVCEGEGPITTHELVQALQAGGRIEDIQKVSSLWYRDGRWIGHGPAAPNINLDLEPILPEAWALMPPPQYHAHLWHGFYADYDELTPYANPFSSEGCPHKCTFCNIQSPFRRGESLSKNPEVRIQRRLNPQLFIKEVEFLAEKYGASDGQRVRLLIKVPDEMFGLNPKHVSEICEGLKEINRRCNDGLNIWGYWRIDSCKPEHLDPLREAGFRHLAIGVETADGGLRDGMDKDFSNEDVYKVVERIQAAGIETGLNYILGCPGETVESMAATRKMAEELNSAFANFYPYMALPGSPAHRMATALGYPLPERQGGSGWEGYAYYGKKCEPFCMGTRKKIGDKKDEEEFYFSNELTPEQILAWREVVQQLYYTRPAYLDMIRRNPRFGERAAGNISGWMKHMRTLKRDLFGGCSFFELPQEKQLKLIPASILADLEQQIG